MTLKNFIYFKDEIECILRRRFLNKYVKNDQGKEKVNDHPPPRVEVINMIIGKIAVDGDSNSTKKSYAYFVGVYSI